MSWWGMNCCCPGGVNGYWAAGLGTGGTLSSVEGFTFATEANAIIASAALSASDSAHCGLSNGSTAGYWFRPVADKTTFATDTTSLGPSSADSPGPDRASCTLSDLVTKGYILGGQVVSTPTALTDLIVFSTETTAAQASADLSQARDFPGSVTEGANKGYVMGGGTGVGNTVATGDLVTYSTDTTAAQASANLPVARRESAGLSNGSDRGYTAGGETIITPVVTALASKIIFSTDTSSAQASANLSVARRGLAAMSDGSAFGWWAGGASGGGTGTSERSAILDKITFSTETTAASAPAALQLGRFLFYGFSKVGW